MTGMNTIVGLALAIMMIGLAIAGFRQDNKSSTKTRLITGAIIVTLLASMFLF